MSNQDIERCKWILYPDKPCKNKVGYKHYCKLHKRYEDIFHPSELSELLWCKKCKQRVRKEDIDERTRCPKCVAKQQRDIENRKSKKPNPCCWLNQKGQQCSWKALPDKEFCKRHSIYEGVFTKDNIQYLKRCSTCKNMFKQLDGEKTCEKCHIIAKKNRQQTRKKHIENGLCKGIYQSGKACTFKPLPNDEYCEKHQSYKKWKQLTDSGKHICKNWIRGCFNEIDKHSNYKYLCEKCNYLTNHDKLTIDIHKNRLCSYKVGAKQRGLCWNLENDFVYKLFTSPCYYCNYYDGRTGIDRLDSSNGYILENVVPCCTVCNRMKLHHSHDDFINLICHLNYSMNLTNVAYYYSTLFEKSQKAHTYPSYSKSIKSRNVSMHLTNDEYQYLLCQPCHYCKCFPEGANGIDRVNSSLMYVKENCVPCCKTCNRLKLQLNLTQFNEKLIAIFNTRVLHTPQKYDNPRNKILALLSLHNFRITDYSLLRLYDNEEYYYSRMFSSFTMDDIKRIKVKMVFIEPSTMKEEMSIWKFYKRKISSLKIRVGHRNVGRRIYILVQDETTETDLGIISLTSDIKNVKARDTHIGWSQTHQYDKKRLQQIMNLSTCVSTQPFGYNTNGGKLLTSLAFSKEVYQYVHDKYNTHIHGITTMSIYGKSIQYDRLSQLKFVGYTNGNTTSAIPQEVVDYMKTLEPNRKDILYLTKQVCLKYDIPIEDLTRGIRKGIYFGFTHANAKEYLCCQKEEQSPIPSASTIDEITEWWKSRWGLKRLSHLTNTNRIQSIHNQK